ncbi:MAG: hypothetical protein PWP24_1446 [Clostridiales bacterium]|nr:hypothetical protein [Clostridiales bacterium]
MDMYETITLCGCSAYEQKYFLNPKFLGLPEAIKEELKIMCVLYTEDVGGILTLEFDEEGALLFQVRAEEGDLLFDEIGSVLKVKQLQREKEDLLSSLALYYRAFILKEDLASLLEEED